MYVLRVCYSLKPLIFNFWVISPSSKVSKGSLSKSKNPSTMKETNIKVER